MKVGALKFKMKLLLTLEVQIQLNTVDYRTAPSLTNSVTIKPGCPTVKAVGPAVLTPPAWLTRTFVSLQSEAQVALKRRLICGRTVSYGVRPQASGAALPQ